MQDKLQADRDLTVLLDGSPMYLHTFGAIASGAGEYVEMASTFPRSRGYAPLTSLMITNNSGEFVDLEINGNPYSRIPGGVVQSINDQAIWTFRLTNNDSTAVASGEITANISTPPLGADQAARMRLRAALRGR
jgi:hypothetical protein